MNIATTTYQLTQNQIEEFQIHGHILLKNLALKDEIDFFRPIIKKVCGKLNTEERKLEDRDTYGQAFLQIMNLWTENDFIKKFVFAERFAQVAAKLLGVNKVRLYHDQALFKEPKGGYTPWHQDQYYWPLDTDKTITMWMPLVDISKEMGMLTFASGSHKFGEVKSDAISDQTEVLFDTYIKEHQFSLNCANLMVAGDATFHSGWTIHGAGPNDSPDKIREVLTVIYYADGVKIQSPSNRHQQTDLEKWLGNKSVGEIADSPLNPILN